MHLHTYPFPYFLLHFVSCLSFIAYYKCIHFFVSFYFVSCPKWKDARKMYRWVKNDINLRNDTFFLRIHRPKMYSIYSVCSLAGLLLSHAEMIEFTHHNIHNNNNNIVCLCFYCLRNNIEKLHFSCVAYRHAVLLPIAVHGEQRMENRGRKRVKWLYR